MITITIIIYHCKPKWIRKAVKKQRRAAREDTDSSTRSFPPWQWQNTNQIMRFQKRCYRKNIKNVPAIAKNNDLEQGSSAQRHSCLRWGRNALGVPSFVSLLRDLIPRSTTSTKGEKERHFRSLSALFLY